LAKITRATDYMIGPRRGRPTDVSRASWRGMRTSLGQQSSSKYKPRGGQSSANCRKLAINVVKASLRRET